MICRPLARVVQQANAIADGDLSKELDRKDIGNDELGDLADSIIQMQSNLKVDLSIISVINYLVNSTFM